MSKVLFACVHNARQSQAAISAGTEPARRSHPELVEVMKEVASTSRQRSRSF